MRGVATSFNVVPPTKFTDAQVHNTILKIITRRISKAKSDNLPCLIFRILQIKLGVQTLGEKADWNLLRIPSIYEIPDRKTSKQMLL